MAVVYWALSELASYSVATWAGFVGVAFMAARVLGKPGIFLGHIVIAMGVAELDVRWIQSEMHKAGWDGQPDQDFVFMVGVGVRIVLVNMVLLPISWGALRMGRRGKSVGSAVGNAG